MGDLTMCRICDTWVNVLATNDAGRVVPVCLDCEDTEAGQDAIWDSEQSPEGDTDGR